MPIMDLVMFRTLLTYVLLRRLRIRSPQCFDGARALAAINACIEQDLAELNAITPGSELLPPGFSELAH
jgi:hypothetical protein